jgi:hypothetical protein
LPLLQVGVGVGTGGRADVAALAVRDHEEARRARILAGSLEGAQAVGAERLEERKLRLHSHDVRRHRVHESAAEAGDGVCGRAPARVGVPTKLDGKELGPRVEPDEELAALAVDRLRDAVGERRCRSPRTGLDILRHRRSLDG